MEENGEIVKSGTALYDGMVPYHVKIVRSSILFGTGDYEDPLDVREDRVIECFYIWYESPGSLGSYKSVGGATMTIDEAMKKVKDATANTVEWLNNLNAYDQEE